MNDRKKIIRKIIRKISNFLYYYKTAAAAVLLAAAAAVFLIRDIHKERAEQAFYVMAAGLEPDEEAVLAMQEGLSQALALDEAAQQCVIETAYSGRMNMESGAVVSAYMRSGRVDLLIAPEEIFNRYAAAGCLAELESSGYGELLEGRKAGELFYASPVDYSRGGAVTGIPYHPHEVTEDSGCYGICLEEGPFKGCAAGIMANCPDGEYVEEGLRYILEASEGQDE